MAVLGTFWLPGIRRRAWRIAATSVVVAFAVINFVGMSFGIGNNSRIAISLPGAQNTFLYTWKLTLYQDQGWLRGGPEHDADVPALIRGMQQTGVTQIGVDPITADAIDLSIFGIEPYADMLGLSVGPASMQTRTSVFLFRHVRRPGDPAPCQRLDDGTGIYAVRGRVADLNTTTLRNAADPHLQYAFVCPGRNLTMWPPRTS